MKTMKTLIFMLATVSFISISGKPTEQDLINHLMINVSKYARPVLDPDTSIEAKFGIELIQLVKVNDREQLITTKVWVRQSWTTDIFKWNVSEWSGIGRVQLDSNDIWTPDVVLYNNGEADFSGGPEKYKTLINVYPDGKCAWLSPATFTSTCGINIRNFPFDRQDCKLKFGSWTFNAKGINLTVDSAPLITSQFINSSEWTVSQAEKVVNSVKYNCCPYPFIDVTFTFVLLRKPMYYIFNVIAPCLVLVCTVLFGFFLPPESGERISLTITILLAVAVFLQLVSDALPRNSDNIPMLAVFYMVVMTESAFSLVTTCIVLVFHYRGLETNAAPMPKWVKRIFLKHMAYYLCIKRHSNDDEEEFVAKDVMNNLSNINAVEKYEKFSGNGYVNKSFEPANQMKVGNADNNLNSPSIFTFILKEIKVITTSMKDQDKYSEVQDDWKFLARVLDRLFFWLFFVTIVTSCLVILVPAYYINN